MRLGVFGLNVMDIGHRHDFAAQFTGQLYVKIVQQLLLGHPVIAHRNIKVVMIKNLVEGFHVFASNAIAPCRHTLAVLAEEIACNGDNAFFMFFDDRQRNRRNFCPTVTIFVAVTDNAEQVIIARFVFDQKSQPFKCRRIFLVRARRIHVNVAAVNRLYRRKPLFFTGLVQVLSASLNF